MICIFNLGHFSYECTSKERPYVARPSRTAQLKNPIKLKRQKSVAASLPKPTGLADKILEERGRKKDSTESNNSNVEVKGRNRGRKSPSRSLSRSRSPKRSSD